MVAPNGARRMQVDHPALPVTAAELADCALQCVAAGANALHLHVRGELQDHTLDASLYRAAITAIHAQCSGLAIQCTTEAAGKFGVQQQFAMVRDLRPRWVSFALGEMMRDGEQAGLAFLQWAHACRIQVQFILYTPRDIAYFAKMLRSGQVPGAMPQVILVAGRYGADDMSSLTMFEELYGQLVKEELDRIVQWMTCAFGPEEIACLTRALECGSHIRVGFENAVTDSAGRPRASNAESVAEIRRIAEHLNIPIATPHAAATQLGMTSPYC